MEPRLKFNVRNQTINRVDNFYVVEKSKNYLYADFSFLTDDWKSVPAKTAIFEYKGGTINVILENDSCLVPWEVLESVGKVYVSVFGGDLITVSKAQVTVNESGYTEGSAPQPPTPNVYDQIMTLLKEARDRKKEYILIQDITIPENIEETPTGVKFLTKDDGTISRVEINEDHTGSEFSLENIKIYGENFYIQGLDVLAIKINAEDSQNANIAQWYRSLTGGENRFFYARTEIDHPFKRNIFTLSSYRAAYPWYSWYQEFPSTIVFGNEKMFPIRKMILYLSTFSPGSRIKIYGQKSE